MRHAGNEPGFFQKYGMQRYKQNDTGISEQGMPGNFLYRIK